MPRPERTTQSGRARGGGGSWRADQRRTVALDDAHEHVVIIGHVFPATGERNSPRLEPACENRYHLGGVFDRKSGQQGIEAFGPSPYAGHPRQLCEERI